MQQSTIDDLKAKKKQFQDAHDKKHEMLKDPRPLGLEGMSLLFGLGPKMNYYVVEEHIINSFFSKDWLSSELSDAVLMGIEGVIGEIDEGMQMKSMIGDWFNCNTLSLYRKTAAYSASQVFSKYFLEIFTDAKLIRKLEVLPEEDIQAAIERGLLHE